MASTVVLLCYILMKWLPRSGVICCTFGKAHVFFFFFFFFLTSVKRHHDVFGVCVCEGYPH